MAAPEKFLAAKMSEATGKLNTGHGLLLVFVWSRLLLFFMLVLGTGRIEAYALEKLVCLGLLVRIFRLRLPDQGLTRTILTPRHYWAAFLQASMAR